MTNEKLEELLLKTMSIMVEQHIDHLALKKYLSTQSGLNAVKLAQLRVTESLPFSPLLQALRDRDSQKAQALIEKQLSRD